MAHGHGPIEHGTVAVCMAVCNGAREGAHRCGHASPCSEKSGVVAQRGKTTRDAPVLRMSGEVVARACGVVHGCCAGGLWYTCVSSVVWVCVLYVLTIVLWHLAARVSRLP